MNAIEVLNDLLAKSDLTKAGLARAAGLSPQALDVRLRKTANPKADNRIELLGILGYDLAVVRKGARLPEGSAVLSASDGAAR